MKLFSNIYFLATLSLLLLYFVFKLGDYLASEQYIKLVELNPTYELVNVNSKLKNISVLPDAPKYQLYDNIL